jgi:uncharacterized membrane protein YczE
MKVCFDCMLVAIAVLIGIFARGKVLGVREGTVAAAMFVGLLSKPIGRPMTKLMDRLLGRSSIQPEAE